MTAGRSAAPVWAVASSPTQVLHAFELLAAEGSQGSLTVLRPPGERPAAQVEALLRECPVRDVELVDLNGRASTARKLKFLRAASRRRRGQRLALGEYRLALLRDLARRTEAPEVLVLDDGNATLLVNSARRAGSDIADARFGQAGRNLRHRLQPLAGIRGTEPVDVTFFTIYDLAIRSGDRVRRHGFGWLRSRHPDVRFDGSVAMVGSTLVESGIISEGAYASLLDVAMSNPEPPTVYLPHRREDADKVARLTRRLGLEVDLRATPIEHAFRADGRCPVRVWCMPSTPVDTLPVAIGPQLKVSVLVPDRSVIHPADRLVLGTLMDAMQTTSDPSVVELRAIEEALAPRSA